LPSVEAALAEQGLPVPPGCDLESAPACILLRIARAGGDPGSWEPV